ncbi:MAG: serine/threonine-protein kinase PknK [Deltaproteobacteria bacterium]|jgi:tetratricopeptide (TPR) repeat protein|nr:serine/threonine-protein kinase PknK [Deltaproteobacteria bacterium]MBW2534647.1 serine/threonine-protein kinase PknK [Deltaproteobacteria bacterium]
MSSVAEEEFADGERFQVERHLGVGGFGDVVQAFDAKRQHRVALKRLHRADATSQYRFKKEFRSLANIAHPNLVQLFELFCEEERWFFTMELVDGCNFIDHVNRACETEPSAGSFVGKTNLARLELALRQLVEGIMALHAAGKLHMDLKPSNVLVTRDGRVVLLDFGLVRETSAETAEPESLVSDFVGTPHYASPEQAAGNAVSPASDWYSVGAMLFQTFAGRLPVEGGTLLALLQNKQTTVPPHLSELVPEVPEHLDALCADLLEIDPHDRPSGPEILDRLSAGAPSQVEISTERDDALARRVLVGREQHLMALAEAYRVTREGRALAIYVHGRSGMGKTALVEHFLATLAAREQVTVLAGRCYQQESVPFNAWDGVIDSLTRHLRRLSAVEAASLRPDHTSELVRLFPVLARVKVLEAATKERLGALEPQDVRELAIGALRELFARLARRQPLVVFIDDLQWGDLDSAVLLRELLLGPEPPPMLLIGCYRSDEQESNPVLMDLMRSCSPNVGEALKLKVSPLSKERAVELAKALLSSGTQESSDAETIALESGGNPLFIAELARFATERGRGSEIPTTGVRLDEFIRFRASALPEGAQRLLQVVAVAARPTPVTVCLDAAGQTKTDLGFLGRLKTEHFVRLRSFPAGDALMMYGERVRESLLAGLSPEAIRKVHRRLAEAFERSESAYPERLAIHFRAAGNNDKAAKYAADAADRAFRVSAFEHAARLYRRALKLRAADDDSEPSAETLREEAELQEKFGDALAAAGRMDRAAQAYLAAAPQTAGRHAMVLRRRGAIQLIHSKQAEQGLETLRELLADLDLSLPRSKVGMVVSFVVNRVRAWLMGFDQQPSAEDTLEPAERLRLETAFYASLALLDVDSWGAVVLGTRFEVSALKTRDPKLLAMAWASEGIFRVFATGTRAKGADELFDRAQALANATDDDTRGVVSWLHSLAASLQGRWAASVELGVKAIRALRMARSPSANTHRTMAEWLVLEGLLAMGEITLGSTRLCALIDRVDSQGDVYISKILPLIGNLVWLARDDAAGALREIHGALSTAETSAFPSQQHIHGHIALVRSYLYAEDVDEMWRIVEQQWQRLVQTSFVRMSQPFRIMMYSTHAAAVLARAGQRRDDPRELARLLKLARHDEKRLRSERVPWATAFSLLTQAGIAHRCGHSGVALERLAESAEAFEAIDMALHAAAARRHRGVLLGDDEGAALVESADDFMRSQNIVAPERMACAIAPCFH